MAEGPEPGAYDETRLREELERLLSDCRERGWNAAYSHALRRDQEGIRRSPPEMSAYGSAAAGLLTWITGQRQDAEVYDVAHALLLGPDDDPRREKVLEVVHRIAAGAITWDELRRVERTPLIPRERPMQVPPRVDAIPIKAALSALEALLDEAGLDTERPDASAVWAAFTAFVARPVAGGNLHLEDDMCVFQWGVGTYGSV